MDKYGPDITQYSSSEVIWLYLRDKILGGGDQSD